MVEIEKDPLATAPIGKLMLKYAIPSVIALVVNSLYNIVDQIFIGWGVGTLGNSATNVIFPLNMIVMALALLLVHFHLISNLNRRLHHHQAIKLKPSQSYLKER